MGHSVVARIKPESAGDLVVQDEVGVATSVSRAMDALKPVAGDMFGIWELSGVGRRAPSKESAEEHVQSVLPSCVMVFSGGRPWMLDDSHIDCVRQSCRG
ncbi:hypothetical protein [Streptomyces sp. NPDC001089]